MALLSATLLSKMLIIAGGLQLTPQETLEAKFIEFLRARNLLHLHQRLEFLHIPKTGGSTIEQVGISHQVMWGMYRFGNYTDRGPLAEHPKLWVSSFHAPPAAAIEPIRQIYESAEKVFCITRNPYERAISEYTYRMTNPDLRRGPSSLYEGNECTTEGLNIFIQRALTRVVAGEKFILDQHLVPQSEYIWEGERQWCTAILRLDGLPYNFNNLMKSMDMDIVMDQEHSNPSSCTLPLAALSNKSKSLIQSVYHDDCMRLKYQT
jgi:hypothetical protein